MISIYLAFPRSKFTQISNIGARWTNWLERFERFVIVTGVKDDTRKRAMLIHYAGTEVDEIFDNLPDTGEAKDYKKAVDALTKHFQPKVNVTYEVFKSGQARA